MQRNSWNNNTASGGATKRTTIRSQTDLTPLNKKQRNPRPYLQINGNRRPGVGDDMNLADLAMKEREFRHNMLIKPIQTCERQWSFKD